MSLGGGDIFLVKLLKGRMKTYLRIESYKIVFPGDFEQILKG